MSESFLSRQSESAAVRGVQVHERYRELLHKDVSQMFGGGAKLAVQCCPVGCTAAADLVARTELQEEYYRCLSCGALFLGGRPSDKVLMSYNQQSDSASFFHGELMAQAWLRRKSIYTERLDRMAADGSVPPADLLDVGCSVGGFLSVAEERGWNGVGLELNEAGLAEAGRRGIEVCSHWEQAPATWHGRFQAITLWEVVAHFDRPLEYLSKIREWLAPGGRLYCTTPNIEGLEYQVLGGHHENCAFPFLQIFSLRALRALLAQAGFFVEVVATPGRYDVSSLRAYLQDYPQAEAAGKIRQLFAVHQRRSGARTDVELQNWINLQRLSGHLWISARSVA